MAAMQRRNLLILAAVTLVVVIAAVIASLSHAPQRGKQKTLLFPQLADRINDTAEVSIRGIDRSVTLVKQGDQWVVREAGGYPARFDRIRRLLLGMTNLRVLAEKTSTPRLYSRIGVEDPDSQGAASHLVTLKDGSGRTLATLIVGKQQRGAEPTEPPGVYVRPPDDKQSLLVEGRLPVSSQITDWFDQNLFSVKPDRIASIVIHHPGLEGVRLVREESGEDFEVEPIPAGRERQSDLIVARMETVLENTFAGNVTAAADYSFPEDHVETVIRTFDGLVARVRGAEQDGRNYVAFEFGVDEARLPAAEESGEDQEGRAETGAADIRAEAENYNNTVAGWIFTLPDYRYELFTRSLDDLTRPAE